jgi:hypothetical protein
MADSRTNCNKDEPGNRWLRMSRHHGHLHRNIRATVGGRSVMTSPSTAHAVQLDIAENAEPMYRMEPAGYLLHWWNGSGLVTHHVPAIKSSGPFPFFDDSGKLLL